MAVVVLDAPLEPGRELEAFRARVRAAGAVVSFLGSVRAASEGRAVAGLFLDHFPGLTERALAGVEHQARARWAVRRVLIHHRVGALAPGDAIVLVAAAADHRRDAFEAASFMMDALKTDAPFWKKESYADGTSRWLEPADADRAARRRWTERIG